MCQLSVCTPEDKEAKAFTPGDTKPDCCELLNCSVIFPVYLIDQPFS
jgi:hypothetical protein